jgi:tetratricopeptide (TPR) repeat protein
MNSFRKWMAAAALAATLGTAGAQQALKRPYDFLADPDFMLATRSLSAADALELAAHLNMDLRQYQQAIPMYEALLKSAPNNAGLWAVLAAAYNRIDEPREAFEAADIAITLAPHYPHFRIERGIAAFRLQRYDVAIDDLQHFSKAFTVDARARFYLGLAQAAAGDAAAARKSLIRARNLNPALSVLTDYYLALIAGSQGQTAASRQMLADTLAAFEAADLPVAPLARRQLQEVDGSVARALRRARHEADARVAHVPGSPASR